MTACTADRNTPSRPGKQYVDPVAAGVKGFVGALAVLDATGNAKPAVTGTGLTARGVFTRRADNSSGAAGDITAEIESGIFAFGTDGSITRAHIGKAVFIVDDQTLAATDGAGTRSSAGILKDLEGSGSTATAWVQVG